VGQILLKLSMMAHASADYHLSGLVLGWKVDLATQLRMAVTSHRLFPVSGLLRIIRRGYAITEIPRYRLRRRGLGKEGDLGG
jgi:hypothetical protein